VSSEILRHVVAMSICQGNSNVNMSGCHHVALGCGRGVRSIGRDLSTAVRAMEAHCASRLCATPSETLVLEENLDGPIQEHMEIDGLMGPRDEGRALGKGKDDPMQRHGVVLGHHPPVREA
jgi:hypothetical protein